MARALAMLAFAGVLAAAPAVAKTGTESVLHAFDGSDGGMPESPVIGDAAGNLYGTTLSGGPHGDGTVFRIAPDGTFTMLYGFSGGATDANQPIGAIAMDSTGAIFGAAEKGGPADAGAVYQLSPPVSGDQWQLTILHYFCSKAQCADGKRPYSGVVRDRNGVLYGTTNLGGKGTASADNGVVYKLMPPADGTGVWQHKVLYDFCSQSDCADGYFPEYAPLLLAKGGMLYGTVPNNGPSTGGGVLYRLRTKGGGFEVLHSFTAHGSEGGRANGGVVMDENGVLYGTTVQGGAYDCGTAYTYDTVSTALGVIYSFCSDATGAVHAAIGLTLVQGKNGLSIYGASSDGGPRRAGTLFALTPPAIAGDPWHEKVLHRFCSDRCDDGADPLFGLLLHRDGGFFGTTSLRGAGGQGVVFRYEKR